MFFKTGQNDIKSLKMLKFAENSYYHLKALLQFDIQAGVLIGGEDINITRVP